MGCEHQKRTADAGLRLVACQNFLVDITDADHRPGGRPVAAEDGPGLDGHPAVGTRDGSTAQLHRVDRGAGADVLRSPRLALLQSGQVIRMRQIRGPGAHQLVRVQPSTVSTDGEIHTSVLSASNW